MLRIPAALVLLALGPRVEELPPWFHGSLDDAEREARERNVPLVILSALDGEEASDRFVRQLREAKELFREADNAVYLVIQNGSHPTRPARVEDESGERVEIEVCRALLTRTCEHHMAPWDDVYRRYVVLPLKDEWQLPEAVLVAPDGAIAGRLGGHEPPPNKDILAEIRRVRRGLGPALGRRAYAVVGPLARTAREAVAGEAWGTAWRSWRALRKETDDGPLGEESAKGLEVAEKAMEARIEAALAPLGDETAIAVYRDLCQLRREYRDCPPAKRIGRSLADIEKRPATRAEIRRVKVEEEAEDMLDRALGLRAEGDERGARKYVARLLRTYPDTPAAEKARSIFEDDEASS